ncbi:MAG: uracil-DNA glycosylase family protein [Syntrophales bacterium]
MKSIVPDIFSFYEEIEQGNLNWIKRCLDRMGISIIADFTENKDLMELFYRTYVEPYEPHVVICGINPGRFGSGKVGVPFLDSRSLSRLLGLRGDHETEKSARFFYSVIRHFGAHRFYSTFYVTNISWLGFTKRGKNINYFKLPAEIRRVILDRFIYEMGLVKPTHIISAGREVQKSVMALKKAGRIDANVDERLNHPRWCGIDTNREKGYRNYISLLEKFVNSPVQQ